MKNEILKQIKNQLNIYAKHISEKQEIVPGKDVIPFARRVYDEQEIINLIDASLEFWLTTGRYAEQFEKKFKNYFDIAHCHLVNSGSSANLLAITALTSDQLGEKQLKPGDEIITVAAGFPTTVNPIVQNNLVPVFVDIDLKTYNINIDSLKNAVSEKTRAIILAHTLGNPCNLKEVMEVVQENDLFFIEDCCDALGSEYNNQLAGTFGDIATFSFYPAHHITMGEGGALITNDDKLSKIIKSFRDWGRDCYCEPGTNNTCGHRFSGQYGNLPQGYDHKYVYSHIGYNLKMTDLQAAIGVAQFEKLESFIIKRRENFTKLKSCLSGYTDYLILPEAEKNSNPSWFGFPITVKENAPFSKNDLTGFLEENKIMTRLLFAGNITKQPAYKKVNYKVAGDLKNTDYVMNNTFFIGVYPGINDEHIGYISKAFDKFMNKWS